MGWFDTPDKPAPQLREKKYTIEKVKELLTDFGRLRLKVSDPRMKVLISQITWNTVPYLESRSGGAPTGAEIADVMTTIEMLTKMLNGYIAIQNNPSSCPPDQDPMVLLQDGFNALDIFWQKINPAQAASAIDMTGYNALTGYLSGNTPPISAL